MGTQTLLKEHIGTHEAPTITLCMGLTLHDGYRSILVGYLKRPPPILMADKDQILDLRPFERKAHPLLHGNR